MRAAAAHRPLPRSFYARDTLTVTADLIGKVLVHRSAEGIAAGAIVEVEAYIGESDPACHAAPGPTARNAPLYGPPGVAYVYLNYGMHYLVNAVTEEEGSPAAILIRALEPIEGVELMARRRMGARPKERGCGPSGPPPRPIDVCDLCRGPGNLTRALGISLSENRLPLTGPQLSIEDWGRSRLPVVWGPRIGIRVGTDRPWRCWAAGHACVSGPRRDLRAVAAPERAVRRSRG